MERIAAEESIKKYTLFYCNVIDESHRLRRRRPPYRGHKVRDLEP